MGIPWIIFSQVTNFEETMVKCHMNSVNKAMVEANAA
jgi:hypothetical protein